MKLLKTFTIVLLGLLAGVGSVHAQDDVKIYFASLKAQSSPESTGSGQVKLTWVDITGAPMTVTMAKQLNYVAFNDPSWVTRDCAYDGYGETAQVLGGTMSAIDGMETMIATDDQIFMTSFVYYYAQAQPSNGSYLADWTFVDPSITKMTEPMGGEGSYIRMIGTSSTTINYNNPLLSPCFKVLPDTVNNAMYSDQTAVGTMAYTVANTPGKYNNLYAVFNKYLLSNPQAENGHMNTNESSATFNVSVDVEGDASQLKADYADFDFPASNFVDNADGTWSWAHDSETPIENISSTKKRYNFTITFTPKTTSEGRKNATLTIRMAHADPSKASTLNIPLSVDVRPAATAEATLYDGKTPTATSGMLTDMITAANNTNKIVVLNQDYSAAFNVNANVTIDLNGYNLGNTLTVSGGDVTIAYSKFGGKISSVNLTAGKLTLNGSTIEATGTANVTAVTVASGAILIQNGATIKAKATNMMFATAIDVYGTVEVNDGVMTAHANWFGAFVAKVNAGGKLIVNGGTLSATVNQANNPNPQMSDQSTWSNAYAVFVSSGTGEAQINGGTFNATSNYAGAFAVCGLASMGKITVEKKAVVNAHSGCSQPTAYAVGLLNESTTINEADATINGGKFSATYMEGGSETTPCPPFLCAVYKNLSFKSGYIKADAVYVRDANNFPMSITPADPTLYNIVQGSKDWNEGWRYIAVDESKTSALAAGVPACRIGTVGYTKLEDAIAYANNNPGVENIVIFMTNDYTLPAGYYTLPANATIVVPMSDSQEKEVNKTAPRVIFNDADRTTPYVQPYEFRRLTFASGVNMDVFGDIEMTCSQYASNEAYTGQPTGAYGHIVMEEGCHLTLQNGSEVRAWGFMTGKGEADARRGAIVREMFQLGDWKGALTSVRIVGMAPKIGDDSEKKIFPITQYFIQNVESPIKYHPGSLLSTSAAVSEGLGFLSVSMTAADIGLIGVSRENQGGEDDPAIFLMDQTADADNTWVRKWYDAENDIQVYDINSGAHIGSMVLDMGDLFVPIANLGTVPIKLNSAKFDLPLTCNFKIHLLSGLMDFKQNTSLLPGAEVEVDKESTVSVAMNSTERTAYKAWVDGGKVGDAPVAYTGALYVYDAQDWGKYAYGNVYGEGTYEAYTKVVRYAPSWDANLVEGKSADGRPTKRNEQTCPADAAINVRGTFQTASGFVYTSEHGANIFSTNEDAGTFIFNDDAVNAGTRTVYNVIGSSSYEPLTFYPARLKNGNNTYENTDEAVKDLAYCYQNNKWSTMIQDGCFMKENRGGNDIYYAKPAEYVALANGKTENADHTYSDAAGAGRLFILMDDCQWWEVENVDNLYHCIHPDNDTYYYWDNDVEEWAEKTFTITWKNWDGSIIQTEDAYGTLVDEYIVTYGTMAEFLGTNPTREADFDYTYDFTGWSPALAPVTSDVTYTATYEQKERKYTIIFCQEGGVEIERHFLKHNDVPVCENTPTKVGHTLVWSPAIAAVTGDATYTATWEEEPPTSYKVTFYDYDGETIVKQGDVNVGEKPTPPTILDGKPVCELDGGCDPIGKAPTSEYTYVFDHWSPTPEVVSATSIKSYTAVYKERPKTYKISYFKEDGITPNPTKQYELLPYGATPTPPIVTKEEDEDPENGYTYTLVWKTLDESGNIETVRGDASYKPTYVKEANRYNRYTMTLLSYTPEGCELIGAGTYDEGEIVVVKAIPSEGYEFDKWSDETTNATHSPITMNENKTLTAYVKQAVVDKTVAVGYTYDAAGKAVKDLIVQSNGVASGQVVHVGSLTMNGNAIFEILNVPANTWYAFGLPWEVNTTDGLSYNSGKLTLTENCYIIEFDAAAYAEGDASDNYWKYVNAGATLQPGVFYMIYLRYAASKLDFTKASTAPLANNSITVYYENAVPSPQQAGWNAIANPTLQYATLGLGVEKGQIYIPGEDRYEGVTLATTPLIVGQPLFVQISGSTRTVNADVNNKFNAPRRSVKAFTEYEVRIAPENGDYTDRLYVKASEDKEDRYVIGQDLSKISTATKVAQMWVNRYDAKLCANVVEPIDNQAVFPLGIYAPKDGQYTISTVTPAVDNEDLFVTVNGAPVWNLAQGAYNIDLKAGTTNEYGLLLVYHPVPEISTGCESLEVADKASVRKVLINGQVFIIRDGAVYTIFGQKAQ